MLFKKGSIIMVNKKNAIEIKELTKVYKLYEKI